MLREPCKLEGVLTFLTFSNIYLVITRGRISSIQMQVNITFIA